MIQTVEFAKLSGSGNDFICIDNRDGRYDAILSCDDGVGNFARTFCHRGTGVGADGLIFACEPEVEGVADVAAVFFEADGSATELCGNGTACFIHWVAANGWVGQGETKVLTPAGVVRGRDSTGRYVRVCIPLPEDMRIDMNLTVCGRPWRCDFVVTGVPHLIVYVDDVSELDISHWGPAFRYHERFQPRGVNANFAQVLEVGKLALRTWEYGVEGETLACGTGSAAAAILAATRFNWPEKYRNGQEPVLIQARSGDVLKVLLTQEADGTISDLCLETVVRFLYSGSAHPSLIEEALKPAPEA